MYDGLSQVYCIKPEGRNPLVYKGFKYGIYLRLKGEENKDMTRLCIFNIELQRNWERVNISFLGFNIE